MQAIKLKSEKRTVYDISCDGTFVNALGMNVLHNTDGMNFRMPDKFEWTEDHPYVSTGMNRNTVAGKEYVGEWGDLAEFNDLFMRKKNGLDIDEMIPSSVYLSRKNYADLLDANKLKIKLVGNTLKSKKMPIYIEKFIDSAIVDLLKGDGRSYLEKYYDKIEEIYNFRTPLKDIATVGKIKISLEEYKENCNQLTKGGTKKARQAWYELAIKHNLDVHMGDTIYYINTGTKKNDSDVQRVTKYYRFANGEKTDVTKEMKREWEKLKKIAKDKSDIESEEAERKLTDAETGKIMSLDAYVKAWHGDVSSEDELVFNCVLLPASVVEDEEDHFCGDDFEYNVEKYIKMFNDRIKAHLVCFDRSVRTKFETDRNGNVKETSNILITNPKDRKCFTDEECGLVSGQPFKPEDQDTYDQLMTMEDKEIKFWISVGKEPVYWRECGMDWDAIKAEYLERMKILEGEGIRDEVAEYEAIVSKVTEADVNALAENGVIPDRILAICDFDASTGAFVSRKWNVKIGSVYDILDHNFKAVPEPEDDYDAAWGGRDDGFDFLDAIFG